MKNFFKIMIVFSVIILPKSAMATYYGEDFFSKTIDYRLIDENKIAQEADEQREQGENCETQKGKREIFELAAGKYYLLTKINPANLNAHIYLGYIYNELGKSKLAKEYFYRAFNINPYNPLAHYYFGDYHYKNQDYRKALASYLNSYNNGMHNDYDLNLKIATIYEKFGDMRLAKRFYDYAYYLNQNDEALAEKIRLLDELNFNDSPYYSKQRFQLRN